MDEKPKKIVFASQEQVQELDAWSRVVLAALANREWAEECWISDETCLGDFEGLDNNKPDPEAAFTARMKRASERLGIELHPRDYLVDVARRLMLGGNQP